MLIVAITTQVAGSAAALLTTSSACANATSRSLLSREPSSDCGPSLGKESSHRISRLQKLDISVFEGPFSEHLCGSFQGPSGLTSQRGKRLRSIERRDGKEKCVLRQLTKDRRDSMWLKSLSVGPSLVRIRHGRR